MFVGYHTGDVGVGERDEFGNYEWWTGAVVATDWEKERTVIIDIRNHDQKLVWRGQIERLEGSESGRRRSRAQPGDQHAAHAFPAAGFVGRERGASAPTLENHPDAVLRAAA